MSSSPTVPSGAFAPTRWTLVLRARGQTPEARTALSELCAAYWTPVFRFLRSEGREEEMAREFTQDFFARLLAGNGLHQLEAGHGRFRSFLLGALKHFLADRRDHDRAAKRGSGLVPEPWTPATDTSAGNEIAVPERHEPSLYFDRDWAYAVMERALNAVQLEFQQQGRSSQFETLKPWLVGDTTELSQTTAARTLGLSEGAVKVAIHRLRKRFRERVRAEVRQTVPEADDVDGELRYLVEVLSAN